MTPGDTCVVIPTFNAIEHLKQTLRSLEQQRPDCTSFEVAVVDDGSSDRTAEYLRSYSGPLTLIPALLSENRGRSAARNHGAAASRRSLLIFLDGDIVVRNDFVAQHSSFHDGSAKAVIGDYNSSDDLGRRSYRRYLAARGVARFAGKVVPPHHLLSGNVSLPADVFRSVGGFDEALVSYGEDIDFGMRLGRAGVHLLYSPDIPGIHLHLRSLEDTLAVFTKYGRETIPELVQRYPELLATWRLGKPSRFADTCLQAVASVRMLFRFIKAVTRAFEPVWVPAIFYSYLNYTSYRAGYLQSRSGSARLYQEL